MTLKNRIIFLPLITIFVVSCLSLYLIDLQINYALEKRVKSELSWLANAAYEGLRLAEDLTLVKEIDDIAKRFNKATGARYTFIDDEGIVTGDSDVTFENLMELENHLNRNELRQAKQYGIGYAERYSQTLKQHFVYYAVYKAVTVNHKKRQYFIRVSLPANTISQEMIKMRLALVSVLLLSVAILIALSIFTSKLIAKSVEQDKALLRRKIRSNRLEQELMYELDSLLSASGDHSEAVAIVKAILPNLLPATQGAVSVFNHSRDKLTLIMSWGEQAWPGSFEFIPDECWALRKGHNHQADCKEVKLYCQHFNERQQCSSLCIPLMAHGESIGVLHLLSEQINENMVLVANSVAKRIALAIANIDLRFSLRQQAIKDSLTNLYNRRYMFESLEQLTARALRHNSQIGVILIDVDHFKSFNDNYGHDVGDQVLKDIAYTLDSHTRKNDLVCRYGGEEFCIICPDSSFERTMSVAKKLCIEIYGLNIQLRSGALAKVSISAGVAMYPYQNEAIDDTISKADKALYMAKESGRNCVVAHKRHLE